MKNFNFVSLKVGGVLILLIFLVHTVKSQSNPDRFLTMLSKDQEKNLKADYHEVIKLVKKESKSYDFIEIGEVRKFLKNGQFSFSIEGLPTLTASVNKMDYTDENKFLLLADLKGDQVGFLQLISDHTGVYGQLEVNERSFEIIGLSNRNQSLFVESKKDKEFKCDMKDKPVNNEGKIVDPPKLEERILPCNTVNNIRVLVVYTQNAITAAGNVSIISNRVNNAIVGFNQANAVSGVTTNVANLELAGFELTNYTEVLRGQAMNGNPASADQMTMFNNLRNATLQRKIETNADIVICASDHNHTNSLGWAAAVPGLADNLTYAVFDIDAMPAQPVFQHELGHLFEGRHPIDPAPGDMHAHQYDFKPCLLCSRVFRATIMNGGLPANIQRPNRWSNPTITDNGAATGIIGISNVARHISLNAATISNIRPNTTLTTIVTGPSNVSTIGNYTYTVDFGCSTNHTFQWSTSSDGINFTLVGTNATTYTQFFYPLTPNPLYIRCRVTGADGQVSTANYMTYHSIPSNITIPKEKQVGNFVVYPNPVTNEMLFNLEVNKNSHLHLKIISDNGQLLQTQNLNAVKGLNSFSIDISDLIPGMYSILIFDGIATRSARLVKL